ncbi:MAG: hypothetical protein NTX72_01140 [Candidatus Uhrbacteria bacterium]|nr:hypothetical protein [Candidatus Uhrbacteria bacterium]
MDLYTYRLNWRRGSSHLVTGHNLIEAIMSLGASTEFVLDESGVHHRVVFIAVREKDTSFVKELEYEELALPIEIVNKIKACRVRMRINIYSTNGVGIELDVGGIAKMFLNGDQVSRWYKVFDRKADADAWLVAN